MYEIDMQEMTPEFLACWKAAGKHLAGQVQGGMSWLRAHPNPPVLEHLSFRLGNQLFFVRVEDVDGKIEGPGSRRGLAAVAAGCNGHACILRMKKKVLGESWVVAQSGWGLENLEDGRPIDPISLVSDKNIEMSAWETHDMAVQVVRGQLEQAKNPIMSWNSNPEVNPSIWFVGKSGGPEWVVVRHFTYPASEAAKPGNWTAIAKQCEKMSRIGHFASVGLVSVDQPFESANETPVPLFRGHGMHIKYAGLE